MRKLPQGPLSNYKSSAAAQRTSKERDPNNTDAWISQKLIQIDSMQMQIAQALNQTTQMEKVIKERSLDKALRENASKTSIGFKPSFQKRYQTSSTKQSPVPETVQHTVKHNEMSTVINLNNFIKQHNSAAKNKIMQKTQKLAENQHVLSKL